MQGKNKTDHKMAKLWQGFGDIEKTIIIYIAYTSSPTPLDNIISLSGLPPTIALNLMEDLKKHHLLYEKKVTGKGVYYTDNIALLDYIQKKVPKKEARRIIKRVISFINEYHDDSEDKTLTLAKLYIQTWPDVWWVECIKQIKKAADILHKSGKIEKSNLYYDFIIENFLSEWINENPNGSHIEYFLDSVYRRVSIGIFYPIPLTHQLDLLEKAHQLAKKYQDSFHLARINILLGYTLRHCGQNRRASHYISAFNRIAEGMPNNKDLLKALFWASISIAMHGNFAEAISCYEKMIGDREKFGDNEEDFLANLLIAFCHVSSGRVSRGMGMIDIVQRKAQLSKLKKVVIHADLMKVLCLIQIRKISEAEGYLDKLSSLGESSLSQDQKSALYFCKAYILNSKGDYENAYHVIKKGLIHQESTGMELQGPDPYCPWIIECLNILDSKGFSDDVVNFDTVLRRAINFNNLFIKGVALRYQALSNMTKQRSAETILSDLKLSEKLLKESGAQFELARTRIAITDYYLSEGKNKIAKSYMEKTRRHLKFDQAIFPDDLLVSVSEERRIEVITDRITSINKSLHKDKDRSHLLEMVLSAAMDSNNATQSCLLILNGKNLNIMASRNFDSKSFKSSKLEPVQEILVNAIKKGKEIILPSGDQYAFEKFSEIGINSFIGLPIEWNGSASVYFILSNHFGNNPFPANALPLARMFASYIEIISSISHSYEKLNKMKERFKDETIFYRQEMGLTQPIEKIIGQSEGIKKVIQQIRQVATTDSIVLISGETGVGKELVAKAIHNLSKRKEGPFIPVNLATFPPDLIASELFGHEKGAFTGANEKKKGRFELADRGTIFLDEIGDLAPDVQIKLLRVLQEGTFERLGNSNPILSDFRVIVATNKDLHKEVEKSSFREDLYYRLNVFPIYVPPLRARKKDIIPLAKYFFSTFNKKLDKHIKGIHTEEFNKLMSYHWPGNVRELKHFIERAVILSYGHEITFSGLELETGEDFSEGIETIATLADVEREHIEKTLKNTLWKISGANGAASLLDLPPSTLRHRMKKLGIEKPYYNK